MVMNNKVFTTTAEVVVALGQQVRQARIAQHQEQAQLAERASISVGALRKLELGRGSTVETLVRTLKALGLADRLRLLFPQPTVSPMALLREPTTRARVRVRRGKQQT